MADTAPSPSPSTSSNGESEASSSSSSSSSHLNSPSLLASDPSVGFDYSDPLNFLLRNATHPDLSTPQPDWSELSTLWNPAEHIGKSPFTEMMDFSSNMAIDPTALDMDLSFPTMNGISSEDNFSFMYNEPHIPFPLPTDVISSFTFQPPTQGTTIETPPRRLSVASSSSSSGASLSPVLEHAATPPAPSPAPSSALSDPAVADELVQLVMKSAGVMHAVPIGTQVGGYGVSLTVPPPKPKAKVPIPRLSKQGGPSISATPTPPPSSPASDGSPTPEPAETTVTIGTNGRPKTSHTTIERRYRTNLNARIQSLCSAVPALRVVDRKAGKQAKLEGDDASEEDVIDDRGFVDGVRAARKCSKANVLGKAVEYIRVLKKREKRIKKEQAGLKSLISSLVGGPALLREWEREWTAKFGGPETDELLESELVVRLSKSAANRGDGSDGEDDEDDDGDDDGSDDEGPRKKKKVKTTSTSKAGGKAKAPAKSQTSVAVASSSTILPPGAVVPEKRKRGRPRKNALPPTSSTFLPSPSSVSQPSPPPSAVVSKVEDVVMQAPADAEQRKRPAQQYLLATFALFSFYNSPLTSTSASPNDGHVLNPLPNSSSSAVFSSQAGWGWHDVIQAFHLIVSALVFASIVLPWTPLNPRTLSKKFGPLLKSIGLTSSVEPEPRVVLTLAEALAPARRGTASEAAGLRSALSGAGQSSDSSLGFWKGLWSVKKEGRGFERRGLEQRAWMRLGELAVLGGPTQTSLYSRVRTYIHMRTHISWYHASPSDHITLALLVHDIPILGVKNAMALWEGAREKAGLCAGLPEKRREIISGLVNDVNRPVREYEKLILGNLEVGEAVKKLRAMKVEGKRERYMLTPLGALAGTLVKERTKKHLAMHFISSVVPPSMPISSRPQGLSVASTERVDLWDEEVAAVEKRKTIDAARSLGGSLAELGDILERLSLHCDGSEQLLTPSISPPPKDSGIDGEIHALLNAVLLYKKIFPSSILARSRTGAVQGEGVGAPACGVSILLSPPPSPTQKDVRVVYALRRALGSSVFDCTSPDAPKAEGLVDCADEMAADSEGGVKDFNGISWALEDARDRVVDMLVDLEMEGHGRCTRS